MQYKQFPFAGCTMAFLGFTEEEEEHMKDIAIDNGTTHNTHTHTHTHTPTHTHIRTYTPTHTQM